MKVTAQTFTQEAHCCAPSDAHPELTLELMDGGGGDFLVLKAEHWALDDDAEVDSLAEKMKAMLRTTSGAPEVPDLKHAGLIRAALKGWQIEFNDGHGGVWKKVNATWAINMMTNPEMEHVEFRRSSIGVTAPVTGWQTDKLGSSLAWPADTSTDAPGVSVPDGETFSQHTLMDGSKKK